MAYADPCGGKRYPSLREPSGCTALMFHHGKRAELKVGFFPNVTPVTESPAGPIDGCDGSTPVCGSGALPVCGPVETVNVWGDIDYTNYQGHRALKCDVFGFKVAQAQRGWHGIFGLEDTCAESKNPSTLSTPPQTKYLTLTWDFHYKNPDIDSRTGNYAEEWGSGTITVDALTGNKVASSLMGGTRYVNFDEGGNFTGYSSEVNTGVPNESASMLLVTQMLSSCPQFYQDYLDDNARVEALFPGIDNWNLTQTVSNTSNEITVSQNSFTTDPDTGDPTGISGTAPSGQVPTFGLYFNATVTLADENTAASVLADLYYNLLSLWPFNDNLLYPWRTDAFARRAPLVTRNEQVHASPTFIFNGFTVPDYRLPITGGGTTLDPYTAWTPMAWFDTGGYQFVFPAGHDQTTAAATDLVLIKDGSIIGAPKTFAAGGGTAYPNKYWNSDYENLNTCSVIDGSSFLYTESFGAWNVDYSMPATATQWTPLSQEASDNNSTAGLPGAYLRYDSPSGLVIIATKYAEIKQPAFSTNFFRPCGQDRYTMDSNKTACVTSFTGTGAVGDPYVLTLAAAISSIATNDLCRTVGVGASLGLPSAVWKVTRTSDTVYVLTTKMWDMSSDEDVLHDYGGTLDLSDMFGALLYPNAWPIGAADQSFTGDVAVLAVTVDPDDATKAIVNCHPVPHLKAGDHVDFVNVPLTNNLAVTDVVDEQHFKVIATPSGPYVLSSNGRVSSHGAPSAFWSDRRPKGSYLVHQWLRNFRDYVVDPTLRTHQESWTMPREVSDYSATQACLPYSPCDPMVICISPNGEVFPNGTTYDFPDFLPDEKYGRLWNSFPQCTMLDPFWKQPAMPCETSLFGDWEGGIPIGDMRAGIAFTEDSGSCSGDNVGSAPQVVYFPNSLKVEAIVELPAISGVGTAPALPTLIHFLTLAELDTGTDPRGGGHVAVPPFPGTGGQSGPWVEWAAKRHCAIFGGRFSDYYMNQIIYPPKQFGEVG